MSAEEITAVEQPPKEAPTPAVDPTGTPPVAQPTDPAEEGDKQSPQDRDSQGRYRNPVQPRIDELTRKARENEREAAYWRAQALANQAPAPAAAKKPEAAEFADYGEFVEALADWKAEQKVNAALDQREAKSAEKQTVERRAATWEGRQTEARKQFADYDAVLSASDVPIAPHVGEALLESEFGPQLARHLALNPAIADKLNAMAPMNAAREIGRLEASMEPQTAAAPQQTARLTNAPPPAKTIASAPTTVPDLSKMSMDDYVKHRKAQGASWAR